MPFIIQDGGGSSSSGEQTVIRTQNLRLTEVWVNESPTSSFNAQTLSVDLSNYSMVYVRYLISTGNSLQEGVVWGKIGTTVMIPFTTHKSANYGGRACAINENGLTFENAYNHSNTAANTYVIPTAIYGVKAQFSV